MKWPELVNLHIIEKTKENERKIRENSILQSLWFISTGFYKRNNISQFHILIGSVSSIRSPILGVIY